MSTLNKDVYKIKRKADYEISKDIKYDQEEDNSQPLGSSKNDYTQVSEEEMRARRIVKVLKKNEMTKGRFQLFPINKSKEDNNRTAESSQSNMGAIRRSFSFTHNNNDKLIRNTQDNSMITHPNKCSPSKCSDNTNPFSNLRLASKSISNPFLAKNSKKQNMDKGRFGKLTMKKESKSTIFKIPIACANNNKGQAAKDVLEYDTPYWNSDEEGDETFDPEQEVEVPSQRQESLKIYTFFGNPNSKKEFSAEVCEFLVYNFGFKEFVSKGNGDFSIELYIPENTNTIISFCVFRNHAKNVLYCAQLFSQSIIAQSSKNEEILYMTKLANKKHNKYECGTVKIKLKNVQSSKLLQQKFKEVQNILRVNDISIIRKTIQNPFYIKEES